MNRHANVRYKWEEIYWRKLERSLFKLQKRIYQASKIGDVRKVRHLQKLLVSSKSAKLLAVKRVTQENSGKKTAGVDGVKSLNLIQRVELYKKLSLKDKCKPVRRIWIPKLGKPEKRPLGIPTMEDRAKQALVKMTLEPEWEAKFEPNNYGFRPGRSCQDALESIFCAICQSNVYVLDADIKGCFDNIDHKALLNKIGTYPKLRRLIKCWLKVGIMEGDSYYRPKAGTPQGGVISPLLANIALHGLEYETQHTLAYDLKKHLKDVHNRYDPKRAMNMLHVIRYADDFVVMHENRAIVEKAKNFIINWLSNIGLKLSETKTKIVHSLTYVDGEKPGFDFLGFSVRQHKDFSRKSGFITLIKPSRQGQKRHRKYIHDCIRKLLASTQSEVIKLLNPIVRGWANYYKAFVARKAFEHQDHFMFHNL